MYSLMQLHNRRTRSSSGTAIYSSPFLEEWPKIATQWQRMVLEACWTGIWSDNKVERTLKIGLFNENTIGRVSLSSNIVFLLIPT